MIQRKFNTEVATRVTSSLSAGRGVDTAAASCSGRRSKAVGAGIVLYKMLILKNAMYLNQLGIPLFMVLTV